MGSVLGSWMFSVGQRDAGMHVPCVDYCISGLLVGNGREQLNGLTC
jgi:hypothetical protein